MSEERSSFLKKRRPARGTKKLLSRFARGLPATGQPCAKRLKSFFASFFSKKEVLACLFLASCAPKLATPDTAYPATAYLPTPTTAANATTIIPTAWWMRFNNPTLNDLVAAGLSASPTLAEANANLIAAQQNAIANNGAYLPQIGLNPGQPQLSRTAEPGGPNGFPPYSVYAIGGTISYDPGLFGARKYTFENGAALNDDQEAELEAARDTLEGNIVTAAITLAGDNAQIAASNSILGAEQKLLNLLQQELADGAIPALTVLQQRATILATQTTLPALQTQAEQQQDRLALLTGQLPADFPPPAITLGALTPPAPIPILLPSSYLENRPDLRAARAQVAAQNAALGLAIAHLYPDLQLSASGGWLATTLNPLFAPDTAFWTLAGNLLAPLYQGGQLHARKQQAQAQLAAALAAYHGAVLNAFGEAADALYAIQNDQTALASAQAASNVADQAYNLASQQFSLGAIDYTTVLTAQAAAAQQTLTLVQTKTTLLLDIARLQAAMAS
jgi:NodT family efflux transporter outer membrane factor (OMF) lipoprotein